jgi:hypothetical protein
MDQLIEPRTDPDLLRMADALRVFDRALAQFSALVAQGRQPDTSLADPLFQAEVTRVLRKLEDAGRRLADRRPIPLALHALRPMLMRIASASDALVTLCHVRISSGDASVFRTAQPQIQQLRDWVLAAATVIDQRLQAGPEASSPRPDTA